MDSGVGAPRLSLTRARRTQPAGPLTRPPRRRSPPVLPWTVCPTGRSRPLRLCPSRGDPTAQAQPIPGHGWLGPAPTDQRPIGQARGGTTGIWRSTGLERSWPASESKSGPGASGRSPLPAASAAHAPEESPLTPRGRRQTGPRAPALQAKGPSLMPAVLGRAAWGLRRCLPEVWLRSDYG